MKVQFHSVFSKLIAIYTVTVLLIALGLLFFKLLSTSFDNVDISKKNLEYYSELLTDKIGTPPDLSKAESMVLNSDFEITITGPGVFWSTTNEPTEPQITHLVKNTPFQFLFQEILDYPITIERGEYSFEYNDFHSDFQISGYGSLLFILFIILSLVFNYLSVRHLFKPLQKMTEVALEFGVRNWKQRVRPSGEDELAILGRELDSMADRIEEYIVSMHDLISAVSHEFRTPLTRIRLALEFIEDPSLKESLNEEVSCLNAMIENILEQSRLRTQPETLYTEHFELIHWLSSFCSSYGKRNLPVEFIPPVRTSSLNVFMDKSRLELAMRSLVENALIHAPGSPITIRLKTESNFYTISVEDEGPGIPEQLIPHLGEPFLLPDASRTGSRKSGGFGLGFSIIKAVTEAHKGKLTVRNRSPKGTEILLSFTTAEEQ